MKKVLIVDDNEQHMLLLQAMLAGHDYDVLTAANGVEALKQAGRVPPDIIISDILMPVMDGFALCRKWKTDERLQHIPFVFYTASYTDPRDEELALSLGAARFIVKPQKPAAFIALLQQVLEERETRRPEAGGQAAPEETFYYRLYSETLIRKLEDKMLEMEQLNRLLGQEVAERKHMDEERQQAVEKLRKVLGATVQALALTAEVRDPYTAGHQQKVADLARAIAVEMGLSADQIDALRMAGTIHDIGKISVPAEILSMPRKLTDIEFSLIKTHAQNGYEILKDLEFPWPIARMVLEHHERIDGSGYPNKLAGDTLLLESRIIAVADVVEAMASHRPYRPGLGIDAALDEITRNRGILYDPEIVDACLKLFRDNSYKLSL